MDAAPDIERLLAADWFRARMTAGCLPATHWIERAPVSSAHYRWLEHQALTFPCYPHEITAAQLHDAGRLTLDLALQALENGWALKDASAWNVLFDRGRPVFCDILSFLPAPASHLWPAYAQFQRHFIIPLLLYKHLGIGPDSIFLQHRDGVRPEEARAMLRGLKAWRQPSLEAVTLPTLFARRAPQPADIPTGGARDPALARHLLAKTYQRLRKHLDRLTPPRDAKASTWVSYLQKRDHYSSADLTTKHAFIAKALAPESVRTVLDLGCNTGEFSVVAETMGKQVVAADFDVQCLERLYLQARARQSRIQPLVLNLGRPTPAVGWMNTETPGVLTRARGRFDCIMMLGLIHHLLVSERASLEMILELVRTLEPRHLIIEWIETHDTRFRELAGANAALYEYLGRGLFEAVLTRGFNIDRSEVLPGGTRILYACTRRPESVSASC